MKNIIVVFLLIFGLKGQSQDTIHYNVLSTIKYEIPPTEISIEIIFEENGKTCGPNTQFETAGEQATFFFNDLGKEGLAGKYHFKELNRLSDVISFYPRIVYDVVTKDEQTATRIADIAKKSFAQHINFYYIYPMDYSTIENDAANLAVAQSIDMAEDLMNYIGKSSIQVTQIDDNGSTLSNGYQVNKQSKRPISKYYDKRLMMNYTISVKYLIL